MRVELLYKGVNPGKFGSLRDRNLRAILLKEKVRESHKLMATMASSLGDADRTNKSYGKFVEALLYENIKDTRDAEMVKYYHEHVKHLRPELYTKEDGAASVRGLQ